MSKRAWPWYSFLYAWAGPQGSFWLWILCLVGMWLFFDGTMIRLANREPQSRSVADVASGLEVLQRWVSIEGTELVDAGQLFGKTGESGSSMRVIVDASDPAAARWNELALLANELKVNADPSSPLGRRFGRLRARFDQELESYTPWRCLRLVDDGSVAAVVSRTSVSAPLGDDQGDPLSAYKREFRAAVDLIRRNVKPSAQYTGVLDWTPPSIVARADAEVHLALSNRTLRVGREPRQLPLVIFGGCSLILLFLIGGLQGVLTSDEDEPSSDSEPPSPPPSSEPPPGT
jgi:hypothetical protein